MRSLSVQGIVPEKGSGSAVTNLVGALIGELADDVPDDPSMEGVKADLMAVSRSYEIDKKKDLALRFYLAIRSLLRENEVLRDRLKKSERERMDAQALASHPIMQPRDTPHVEHPPTL
ncbi:MAG TPA: hypothetical protein VMT15_18700 [Bryobacteraceae bacterium]|nr:hypothetical protein [Bryobacteraceae bacterium]